MHFVNNWISWHYDQDPKQTFKLRPDSEMTISVNPKIQHPLRSYRQELLDNIQLIRDSHDGPLDLMFSGGGDSELALRCFKELGIPVNVITFRYTDNINRREFQRAVNICQDLNIKQTVIDLDLKKFYEQDAYDIWTTGYYLNAGRLPHMKMIEYLDNTPLCCDGVAQSALAIRLTPQGEWRFQFLEISLSLANYCERIGRSAVANVFDFSPRPLARFLQIPVISGLFTNRLPHITDYSVIKYQLLNQLYPGVMHRNKLHGFEGDGLPGKELSKPPYMQEFNRQYIFQDYKTCKFKIASGQVSYSYRDMIAMMQPVS
jgi:Queuosine biosynthesis protein QueC